MISKWGIVLMVTWIRSVFIHAQQNFLRVDSCPQNKIEWETRQQNKNCEDPLHYHCAAIESTEKFGEICALPALTFAGDCPVLNALSHNLDFKSCTTHKECPQKAYRSDEVYRHPVCFSISSHPSRFNKFRSSTAVPDQGNNVTMPIVIVVSSVGLITIMIIIICIWCIWKKKQNENEKYRKEIMESELSQKLTDVNEINRETEESSLNVFEKFDYPEGLCDIFLKENWHDENETYFFKKDSCSETSEDCDGIVKNSIDISENWHDKDEKFYSKEVENIFTKRTINSIEEDCVQEIKKTC
ncbi:uncharacterized protein LOC134247274 [Saccostrea cucullata]|uniref:uncharacterized protein LOC134247274 n=1 Tax=Saccostrea cuccullata TaxID=36930 RepID=UPI002ED04B46